MKICMLNILHEAYDKRMYQKIGRSLVAAGHEVVSICPNPEPLPERVGGIRFVQIPPAASKRRRLISLVRLVRLGRRERADVYLAPEPESWVAGLIIKLTRGGKVVYDEHEHAPTEFAKFFPAPLQGFVEFMTVRFMRLFGYYTDHVILTRNSFDREWRGHRVPRTVVINTNHLQPRCAAVPVALQERYAGQRVILHQGVFGDVRGSYQLLEAMKILAPANPDLRCVLLGAYVYGNEQAYRDAVAAAGLEGVMQFHAVVPYEEVPAYIALAEVGLILFQPGLLNHTLAMPHKLFDYMREGKPVIAPDFAVEVAHIVREGDCGILVDVTRPEAIAGAVQQLLDNCAEAQRLGNNGRRIVEDKYNWAADEARLLRIFEDI